MQQTIEDTRILDKHLTRVVFNILCQPVLPVCGLTCSSTFRGFIIVACRLGYLMIPDLEYFVVAYNVA